MTTAKSQKRIRNKYNNQALTALYNGATPFGRPTLFLDFDDVICLNRPYSGGHLRLSGLPADFYSRLWHQPSVDVLLHVVETFRPQVVMTTSWLRFLTEDSARQLFHTSGLSNIAASLHAKPEVLQSHGQTRHDAIENWLAANYVGGPLVVLDDELSGTGLKGSTLDMLQRVVLCEQDVGLHRGHFAQICAALTA